ncbi:MAG: peptidoglycan DD-metalloendopeptidase family protein [Nitrospira sp.]|nr:peptidoglycan DD-metalloendopeptidase family protein [Nitrospira sp.]
MGLLLLSIQAGWGADPSTIKDEISQERLRLEKLNQEIAETRKKTKRIEKKHGSVLKTIDKLDRQLYDQKKERNRINEQIKVTDQELANLSTEIARVEKDVQKRQSSISARLRLLYIEGRTAYLKTLFAAESFTEASHRMDYLSWVAQREHQLVQQFQEDLANLQQLKEQQTAAREDLLRFQGETQQTIKKVSGLKRQKRSVLVSLSKEKDAHERMVEDLQRSAEQVDSLLKELDQRFQLAQSRMRQPPGALPSRGSLLWPVEGKVVSNFGRQKHPTFDTFVTKKGIEISAQEGSPIRAVSSGNVVYADWLKGYGLVVIVDHTNGFYSLYAHASKLLVAEGHSVKNGQVIGETGDTGVTEEGTLYFELRKGTTPIDPLKWLAKQP